MEKCDSCLTRYVCEGECEFNCKNKDYIYYNEDNEKTKKTKFTKEEKCIFMYGYLYRMAEEMKNKGLFKDLEIKELIKVILEETTK